MLDQLADWVLNEKKEWTIERARNQKMVYLPKDSVI
jgi:hypothetical protein